MFSVIISEKGGAERRESFERTEISVGRVQGNELMLPKGNVSKRHARLLFRDGRFIVTDLKSTNGTYVNGRKIAQATIVREGDKIYIGDFVLRIEVVVPGATPISASSTGDEPAQLVLDSSPSSASLPACQPPLPSAQPSGSATARAAALMAPSRGSAPPTPADPAPFDPASDGKHAQVRPPPPRPGQEVISHFPLEHDPDDSVQYALPAPPRVPSTPRGGASGRPVPVSRPSQPGHSAFATLATGAGIEGSAASSGATSTPLSVPMEGTNRLGFPDGASDSVTPARGRPSEAALSFHGTRAPVHTATTSPSAVPERSASRRMSAMAPADVDLPVRARSGGAPPPPRPVDPNRIAAHRAALVLLVDRAGEVLGAAAIAAGTLPTDAFRAFVDQALAEAAAPMRTQADLDIDALVVEARREFVEYGPLTPLLDDEDVSEMQVVRHDYVVAMHGRQMLASDIAFSSEAAVARALQRLCASSGQPLVEGEAFIERRLPSGGRLFAVLPRSADHGHVVVIRKPQRAYRTLDDLVRTGTISRTMAGFFAQCMAGRANILVTGAVGAGTTTLIGALAAAGSTEDRVVVLQEDEELIFNQPHTIFIPMGDTADNRGRAIRAATRIRPDRLVVDAFGGEVAACVVDVIGDGLDGVLAGARSPTLRQAVLRLTADLSTTRPGVSPEVAREWFSSVFDLVIEVARLRDGRHRVLRVAEVVVEGARVVLRDIFTFSVERTAAGGALEGSFYPTGVIPGIVEDLLARGVTIDPALFRRHPRLENPPTPLR